MFITSGLKNHKILWIFLIFLAVWNVESQLPTRQCTATCENECYNPLVQQCFNGTLCSVGQQLCMLKYDAMYGRQYYLPQPTCYNPTEQACLNKTLYTYPLQVCNGQYVANYQVCVDNTTICNITKSYYSDNQPTRMKLCNSVCYNFAFQKCIGGTVRCRNSCSGVCYNSSIQQCLNGTLCSVGQHLCITKYDATYGRQYYSLQPTCYNPTEQVCLDNRICSYPSQICNGRCMGYNQVCFNNVTACNVTKFYPYDQPDQVKLCNGVCYNSAFEKCISGTVRCRNSCSGVCYSSSQQQCFDRILCSVSQQLCITKFDDTYGRQYNPPYPLCYNPTEQVCLDNRLCSYPSQICNERCMGYNQVCVNNVTICNITNYPYNQPNQIKLCNGVCYNSAMQQCVDGYAVNCTRDPSTQQCINQSTSSTQPSTTAAPREGKPQSFVLKVVFTILKYFQPVLGYFARILNYFMLH
ncbi:unnamed protein product [Adineta steineri]|uniref:Uncharacterized protein n=1 Tax=Adineta steineri TaxID=433720 RepID=A0A815T5F9_9BILA|nr:unnamed protein product [Adineta steineri]CAF1644247.1 unnamed protein product [Adineta steineri]